MNLIWQFHTDTQRGYDGVERRRMAIASAHTASAYATEVGAAYMLETHSEFFSNGIHGGPAMDRFQLLQTRYDIYEYILYLDTDIIIRPGYRNIFSTYGGCVVAGHNIVHRRDRTQLDDGWLSTAVDREKYLRSYFHGDIILLSRDFRLWLREHCDPTEIEVDKGKHWDTHGLEVKWPVYDQSLLAYWLTISPFELTPLAPEFTGGEFFVHEGGGKTATTTRRFFERYASAADEWATSLTKMSDALTLRP